MIYLSLCFPREYCFYGMKRSGHHAVMLWAKPICGYPFHLNEVADYPPISDYFPNKREKCIEQYQKILNAKVIAFNVEDAYRSIIEKFRKNIELKAEKYPTKTIQTLILRDPINCFSSRLRHKKVSQSDLNNNFNYAKGLWKQHALLYLEKALINVNYNTWVVDIDYRKELALKLEGEFTDENKNKISGHGGGSSFQGQKISAEQLRPFDRWQQALHKPEYFKYFDEEIFELSRQIFSHVQGFEHVYKIWSTQYKT